MTDILIIKTSSLGDVVHQMPAIVDASRARPELRITWLVEEAFAPLVRLHPLVAEVITVATRRWRTQLAAGATWREIAARISSRRIATRSLAPAETRSCCRRICRRSRATGAERVGGVHNDQIVRVLFGADKFQAVLIVDAYSWVIQLAGCFLKVMPADFHNKFIDFNHINCFNVIVPGKLADGAAVSGSYDQNPFDVGIYG